MDFFAVSSGRDSSFNTGDPDTQPSGSSRQSLSSLRFADSNPEVPWKPNWETSVEENAFNSYVHSNATEGAKEPTTLPNDTKVVRRMTKDKRMLWYCLKIIQQPERAKARGLRLKYPAPRDDRTVDPPPVVQLHIYEGNTWERAQNNDVTFRYDADFFVYTTLEHVGDVAPGHVETRTSHGPPVLTGQVASINYLDRPRGAGYFLFPDLSVRDEGRCRLTFHLYEKIKEDKDKDLDAYDSKPGIRSISSATGGSFDFRMEVKSQDFIVYIARKFPGYTASTALTRTVAEQGVSLRLRIPRDVHYMPPN